MASTILAKEAAEPIAEPIAESRIPPSRSKLLQKTEWPQLLSCPGSLLVASTVQVKNYENPA